MGNAGREREDAPGAGGATGEKMGLGAARGERRGKKGGGVGRDILEPRGWRGGGGVWWVWRSNARAGGNRAHPRRKGRGAGAGRPPGRARASAEGGGKSQRESRLAQRERRWKESNGKRSELGTRQGTGVCGERRWGRDLRRTGRGGEGRCPIAGSFCRVPRRGRQHQSKGGVKVARKVKERGWAGIKERSLGRRSAGAPSRSSGEGWEGGGRGRWSEWRMARGTGRGWRWGAGEVRRRPARAP